MVYERLYLEGQDQPVAVHEDTKAEEQTVRFPKIGTQAQDGLTGTPAGSTLPGTVFNDRVRYENLIPGRTYQVHGALMTKDASGKAVPFTSQDGKPVEKVLSFTPAQEAGEVLMTFGPAEGFDPARAAGKKVVAFEELSVGQVPLASHADIEDEDQTLSYPAICTRAEGAEKTKTLALGEKAVLTDMVDLKGLVPGTAYEVVGTVMRKSDGQPLRNAEGTPITGKAAVCLPAGQRDGQVKVSFTLDTRELAGEELVVFEELRTQGKVISLHQNMEDRGQTVTVAVPKPPAPKPPAEKSPTPARQPKASAPKTAAPKTGDRSAAGPWGILAVTVLLELALLRWLRRRQKEK